MKACVCNLECKTAQDQITEGFIRHIWALGYIPMILKGWCDQLEAFGRSAWWGQRTDWRLESGARQAAGDCIREEEPLSWTQVVAMKMERRQWLGISLGWGSFNVALGATLGPAESVLRICRAYTEIGSLTALFKPQLCSSLVLLPCPNYLTSRGLSFLKYKRGVIAVYIP